MNPFVFACITPHGSEIVEALSQQDPTLMAQTRASMEKLGASMAAANPDAIIVLTPHGVRIDGQFAIADCERMYGEVEDNGGLVKMERVVDRELARAIVNEAQGAGLPAGAVNFATAAGSYSCLPLDWGVIVPLHFMPEVPVVVITPSRFLSYADHLKLGESISRVVQASGKRVGMIASCDWSHAHAEDGPYGYDPAAAELDAKVVTMIQASDLEAMMEFDPAFVDAAKPDGIWQALILAGAIPREHRDVEWLSYEVPTYFGLMCAGFHNR